MKKIEFKTSKGEFAAIDMDTLADDERKQSFVNGMNNFNGFCINDELYEELFPISELTEQQASEVVDSSIYNEYYPHHTKRCLTKSALDSFHSLLDSLGISNWYKPTTYLFRKV